MSAFKDMVARDIHNVFLNVSEFAENRTIRYYDTHGQKREYADIPVVLEGPVQEKRDRLTDDHVIGLHMVTAVLYCAQSDLGGVLPEQGTALEINTREGGTFFQKYFIVAAVSHMGMLHIELEAVK